jgi:hypothetical protein
VSRSNPSEHLQNPSARWFEWNGEKGLVRYYDKERKENVDVPLPFTFILLDELASVRGWHDPSSSGIYSNEVRDTTQEVMVVKSFKGGTIAEGKYREIKDRVNAAGGDYNANCYIAFRQGDGYAIGSIRFKGAALGAWMDFRKQHRNELYKKAVKIASYTEGKKGKVTFRVPQMALNSVSPDAEATAVDLDKELQEFLSAYLKRNKRDQADDAVAQQAAHHVTDEEIAASLDREREDMVLDSDIPFAWLMPLALPAIASLGMLA